MIEKGVILSLVLISACAFIQILTAHILKLRRTFPLLMSLLFMSLPIYVFLFLQIAPAVDRLALCNGLFLHLLIFFNYVQCFYYITQPVTIRMLEEFLKAPGERLTLEELKTSYGLSHMIQARLETLAQNGYARRQGDRYALAPRGKFFAEAFQGVRKLFGVTYYLDQNVFGEEAKTHHAE